LPRGDAFEECDAELSLKQLGYISGETFY